MAPINSKTFFKAAGYNPLRREALMIREAKERKEFAWFDKKYRQLFIPAIYFLVTKIRVYALNSVMCHGIAVPFVVRMNLFNKFFS